MFPIISISVPSLWLGLWHYLQWSIYVLDHVISKWKSKISHGSHSANRILHVFCVPCHLVSLFCKLTLMTETKLMLDPYRQIAASWFVVPTTKSKPHHQTVQQITSSKRNSTLFDPETCILLLLIRGSNGGTTLILTRRAKKKDKS
jgi:hypothetical protein